MKKFIYYLPRILAIIITGFFYMFVLEGFSPEFSWADALPHFVMATVILGITIVSWKWPKIGGFIWLVPGLFYLIIMLSRQGNWMFVWIPLILIIVGILFLVEGFRKK